MRQCSYIALFFCSLYSFALCAAYSDDKDYDINSDANYYLDCDPCVAEPYLEWFISGEVLYWKPNQTAMIYAFSFENLQNFGQKTELILHKSDWGIGFRAGTGFNFTRVPCDLSFYWTQFHHTSHSTTSDLFTLANQINFSFDEDFLLGGSGIGGENPRSFWRLKLDIAELDLGYWLCCNDRFTLRPYLGVTQCWLNQLQSIHYDNFFEVNVGPPILMNVQVKKTNNFRGFGPKLGIGGNLCIGCGFGIMGNFGANFFYGETNSPSLVEAPNFVQGVNIPINRTKYKENRVMPMIQGQVGLTWNLLCGARTSSESAFCNYSIDVGAYYEVQYFWETWRNQNCFAQNIFMPATGFGNLMLQGGTFELRVTF